MGVGRVEMVPARASIGSIRRRRRGRVEGGAAERVRRERSSLRRAEVGTPNTQRAMAIRTVRPALYAAHALIARPLEPLYRLRALKRANLRRGACLARLLEML